MIAALEHCPPALPLSAACSALSINRSSVYARRARARQGSGEPARSRQGAPQPRALGAEERRLVYERLNSDSFCDQPPHEVYQRLLENGEYLCSVSTMHRILRAEGQSGDRRAQRAPQHHAKPRLVAQAPNEVWSWDCAKLATQLRNRYLTLYVVLDLFSRFVLAWMVSSKENSALAQQLMAEAAARYRITPGTLTVHQDRGAPMTAHRYFDLMGELGITLSHSRPRVSNDNPFSEAQFKTQKYQPDYPERFRHAAHATAWCGDYFDWYNFEHHHTGLAGYTPEQVFTGRWRSVAHLKQAALDAQYARCPERFVAGPPTAPEPPPRVEINPVTPEELASGASCAVNFPTLPALTQETSLSRN